MNHHNIGYSSDDTANHPTAFESRSGLESESGDRSCANPERASLSIANSRLRAAVLISDHDGVLHALAQQANAGQGRPSALDVVLERDDAEFLEFLLRSGVSLATQVREQPLLALCAQLRAERCMRLLLLAGVHPDEQDSNGYGALHHAGLSDWPRGVSMLLEAGANVHAKSFSGLKPGRIAKPEAQRAITAWLARAEIQRSEPIATPVRGTGQAPALLASVG